MSPSPPPDFAAMNGTASFETMTSKTEDRTGGDPDASVATADPSHAVVPPHPAAVATATARIQRHLSTTLDIVTSTKFFEVFGRLGVPMVATLIFSALSTFFLAYIQVYPTEVVNAVMKTEHFDNGEFWLLPYPKTSLVVCSTVLLVLFSLGYVGLVVLMLFGRRFPWDLHPKKQSSPSLGQPPQQKLTSPRHRWLARAVGVLRAIERADLDDSATDSHTESDSAVISSSRTRSFAKGKQSLARMYRGTVGHDSSKYRHVYVGLSLSIELLSVTALACPDIAD